MDPLVYLEDIVLPTVEDYQAEPTSRRKAYLACIVAHHLADFILRAERNDGGALGTPPSTVARKRAEAAFNIVRAVATAAKHGNTARGKHPILFTAGFDRFRPPARAGAMEVGWSVLGDIEGGIVIQTDEYLWDSVMDAVRTLIRTYVVAYQSTYFAGFDQARLNHLEFPDYLA